MLKVKLEIVGGAKPSEVELKRFPLTIGRAREASIKLPHNLVSRLHCEILEENGQLYVRDLNSLNGTYVNNERISGSRPLLPGQLLTLGIVTFRAVYELVSRNQVPDVADSDTGHWQHGETMPEENGAVVQAASYGARASEESDTDERNSVAANGCGGFSLESDDHAESIQIVDDDFVAAPGSICLAEMMKLPKRDDCAVSFSGELELNGAANLSLFEDQTVQIELGEDGSAHHIASQSAIDSFVRKLPR